MRLVITSVLAVGIAIAFAGCSTAPDSVVIHDPNTTGSFSTPDEIGSPVAKYGADTFERARAIARARARLAAARTLRVESNRDDAATQLVSARDELLRAVGGRVNRARPQLYSKLVTELDAVARASNTPSVSDTDFARQLDRLANVELNQVNDVVIPPAARADKGFAAAVLSALVIDASTSYEQSMPNDGKTIDLREQYQLAYGMLLIARTTYLDPMPDHTRARITAPLTRLAAQVFPTPTPPKDPRPAEDVSSRLASISDSISETTNIDTTSAPPAGDAPDRLRLISNAVEQAAASHRGGKPELALQQLATAFTRQLLPVAPSVAAVDPSALEAIEQGLGVEMPQAIRERRTADEVDALAGTLRTNIESARESVISEIQLLAEDAEANGG